MTPGWWIATHAVFAGDRAAEFELRLQRASYDRPRRRRHPLHRGARRRLERRNCCGIGTARARPAARATTLETSPAGRTGSTTNARCCGSRAHWRALPHRRAPTHSPRTRCRRNISDDADCHIDAAIGRLPQLQAEGLVDAVDAFWAKASASSPEQTRRIPEVARALGLPKQPHGPAQRPRRRGAGGAPIGPSADHDNWRRGRAMHAEHRHGRGAAARRLPRPARDQVLPPIERDCARSAPMAVATDCNPGTAPLLSRQATQLACTHPSGSRPIAAAVAPRSMRRRWAWPTGVLRTARARISVHWRIRHPAELCYWLGGDLAHGSFMLAVAGSPDSRDGGFPCAAACRFPRRVSAPGAQDAALPAGAGRDHRRHHIDAPGILMDSNRPRRGRQGPRVRLSEGARRRPRRGLHVDLTPAEAGRRRQRPAGRQPDDRRRPGAGAAASGPVRHPSPRRAMRSACCRAAACCCRWAWRTARRWATSRATQFFFDRGVLHHPRPQRQQTASPIRPTR